MSIDNIIFLILVGVIFIYILLGIIRSLRLVPARMEFIVERFGRYRNTLDAGFHFLIPFIDKVAFIQDLKEESTPSYEEQDESIWRKLLTYNVAPFVMFSFDNYYIICYN